VAASASATLVAAVIVGGSGGRRDRSMRPAGKRTDRTGSTV